MKANITMIPSTVYLLYCGLGVFLRRVGGLTINFHHLKNHSMAGFLLYLFSSWSNDISFGSSYASQTFLDVDCDNPMDESIFTIE